MNPLARKYLTFSGALLVSLACFWWWWGRREGTIASPTAADSSRSVVRWVQDPEPVSPTTTKDEPKASKLATGSDPEKRSADKLALQRLGGALGQAFKGMMLYAGAHDGAFPESLDQLSPKELGNEPLALVHPVTGESLAMEYTAGLKTTDSANTLVLATPPLLEGKRLCCFLDGSVRLMSEEDYDKAVQHLPPLNDRRK